MATEVKPDSTDAVKTSSRIRYQRLAQRLREWMAEDDDYDEQVGAILDEELNDSRVRLGETDEAGA